MTDKPDIQKLRDAVVEAAKKWRYVGDTRHLTDEAAENVLCETTRKLIEAEEAAKKPRLVSAFDFARAALHCQPNDIAARDAEWIAVLKRLARRVPDDPFRGKPARDAVDLDDILALVETGK